MVSFYSVYLVIMYFNPRIEAYLYKVTKTTTPEYKSDLHEQNAKNGLDNKGNYIKVKEDEENEVEEKEKEETEKDDTEKKSNISGDYQLTLSKFVP